MNTKEKNIMEDKLSKLVTSFYIDSTGTGPKETKVRIVDDMVVIRLKNQLSRVEQMLITNKRLIELATKTRIEAHKILCPRLTQLLEKELKIKLISCYNDVNLLTSEQMLVFVASVPLNRVG